MNRHAAPALILALSTALSLSTLAPSALAGPPIMCHQLEIGEAKSLPFGSGSFDRSKELKADKVVDRTLELLKTERSTLVRMETLRRAVVYIDRDQALATELLAKVSWIAMDAEAGGKPSAVSWLDAGFLAACYAEMNVPLDWRPGVADGVNGYAWIRRAAELAPQDAELQFAAALVTHPAMHTSTKAQHDAHLRRAAAGAAKGSLLETNLAAHCARAGGSLDQLRALAATDARK